MNTYENCEMRDPSGLFLAFCSKRRAEWYLKKGLATIISENPFVFNLTFTPKGTGHRGEAFFEKPLQNICVVCGTIKNLTRHHVVPSCYRKYFPENKKSYNNHDILLLCKTCHSTYEQVSFEFKKKIMLQNGLNPNPQPDKHLVALKRNARLLLEYDLPVEKYIESMEPLELHFGYTPDDYKLLEFLEHDESLSEFSTLVAKLTDLDDFAKQWRQHFIDSMSPKHLPYGWKVDYIVDF